MKKSDPFKGIMEEMNYPLPDDARKKAVLRAVSKAFEQYQTKSTATSVEFLMGQFRFIGWRTWLLQGMVLILFMLVSAFSREQTDYIYCYSFFAPLLVISAIPQLWRSARFRSEEVEDSAFFDTRKIFSARLFYIGMADLIAATIMLFAASVRSETPVYLLVIYFLVPFNTTCCICFSVFYRIKKMNSDFVCAALCILWSAFLFILSKNMNIYQMVQVKIWYLLVLLTFIYIAGIAFKMVKHVKNSEFMEI